MRNLRRFNGEIRLEILSLAKEILNDGEIEMATKISEMLLQTGHSRQHAIQHLLEVIGTSPKRPVYYLNHEIRFLPNHSTRHVIRFAGDYIDQIVKYCAYEKGSYLFKFIALRSPLGKNLKKLEGVLPEDLLRNMKEFNKQIYVLAKHKWTTEGRLHLFSAKEAVFACFMAKKLASQIVSFSTLAKNYDENMAYEYYYDSTQGDIYDS